MVREFYILMFLLLLTVTALVVHYFSYHTATRFETLRQVTGVTGDASPSLSTAFYEPGRLGVAAVHPAYPEMQTINRLDFVYVE